MRQLLGLWLRAWVWVPRLLGWPRFVPALWGWLGLGAGCAASLAWRHELWPHTPGAASWAGVGLAAAAVASATLVGWGLGRWLLATVPHWQGLARVLGVAGLLAGGLLALLLAGLAGLALLGYAISIIG